MSDNGLAFIGGILITCIVFAFIVIPSSNDVQKCQKDNTLNLAKLAIKKPHVFSYESEFETYYFKVVKIDKSDIEVINMGWGDHLELKEGKNER